MQNRYKIVISGKGICQEYCLPCQGETDTVKIGTEKTAQVRLKPSLFFEDVAIFFTWQPPGWNISGGENIYFTTDGLMKIYAKELVDGDKIAVKYKSSNAEIFTIAFSIDFDAGIKEYTRVIELPLKADLVIGGQEKADLYIQDPLLGKDTVTLSVRRGAYSLADNQCQYGVYVNGEKIEGPAGLKDTDFFTFAGHSFYLRDNRLYTANYVQVNELPFKDVHEQESAYMYPKFQRSARMQYEISNEEIDILPPKPCPPPEKNKWTYSIPFLGMLFTASLSRGILPEGILSFLFAGILMAAGAVWSAIAYFKNQRACKSLCAQREEEYREYLREKEQYIKELWDRDRQILNRIYPSVEQNLASVREFNKQLFERDPKDKDYLHVRLGTGAVPAGSKITCDAQAFHETGGWLADIPGELMQKYRYIMDAPIAADFSSVSAVGFIGSRDSLYDMLKNVIMDIAIRQFYKDVRMVFLFDQSHAGRFSWLRWLKNVNNEQGPYRNLAFDGESRRMVLESLYTELSKREGQGSGTDKLPNYIVFVYNKMEIDTHPVSKFIGNASRYGFTFVFFEETGELVPKGCELLVYLNGQNKTGKLCPAGEGGSITAFQYLPIPDQIAESVSIKLAAVYVDEVNLESRLAKKVTLYDMLGIQDADVLDLQNQWTLAKVCRTMAAPLGISMPKELACLDIREEKHGPHGLLTGGEGSGKTELLLSYMVSMAALFHPHEVGFLLFDFKGGIAERLQDLPHLLGSVTVMDQRQLSRSMQSIHAELNKRREAFAKFSVSHIDQYTYKYAAGEVSDPIPHLIVAVDEFKDLQRKHPAFMEELLQVSRTGESLGIHLLLATGDSGAVTEQVLQHASYRLCMRMETKEESQKIIGSPLAAEIKETGRAYLQTGGNTPLKLFQSGFSGAPAETGLPVQNQEFTVYEIALSGKREPVYIKKPDTGALEVETQLHAAVQNISRYCSKNSIQQLPKICLPPLPEMVKVNPHPLRQKNYKHVVVPIGLYDDPARQIQRKYDMDLTSGNTFIIGAPQTGKTNILRLIIRSVAQNYTPDEVNLYILDFGTPALKPFEKLHHVGGVVFAENEEKLKHFIKMMEREIITRKEKLSANGANSFDSYKEAGNKKLPQIIIFIRNFTVLKKLYYEYDESILRICREGLGVGISVVLSTARSIGVGYKYLYNFSNRIAMHCEDASEYAMLFGTAGLTPENIPGRCLVKNEEQAHLCQSYLAFEGRKDTVLLEDIEMFIEACNEKTPNAQAKRIPEVPEKMTYTDIINTFDLTKLSPYEVPVGIGYENVDLRTVRLKQIGMFSLAGNDNTGKLNFLRSIMEGLNRNTRRFPVKMHIIDGTEKVLEEFKKYPFVKSYSADAGDFETVIRKVSGELEDRQNQLMYLGSDELDKLPLLAVLAHHPAILESIRDNKEVVDICRKITKQFKGLKVCLLFSNVENAPIGYTAPYIYKTIKENKSVYFFNDLSANKVFNVTPSDLQRYKRLMKAGDAYEITAGKAIKIKTIQMDGTING